MKITAMKRSAWTIVLTTVVAAPLMALRGDAAPPEGVARFMRSKLAHAQKVIESLALEDFPAIEKSAKSLFKLSEAADWQVLPDPEYIRYSSEFQQITNEMASAAADKNLDAATLKYVQLTMNCVNCHKHVRNVRKVASIE